MLRLLPALFLLWAPQDTPTGWTFSTKETIRYRIEHMMTSAPMTDAGSTRAWEVTLVVKKVGGSGKARVEMTFDRAQVTYTTITGRYDWDSADPKSKPDDAHLQGGGLFLKHTLKMEVARDGTLSKLSGVKKAVDALIKKVDKSYHPYIRAYWTDEHMTQLLQTTFVQKVGSRKSTHFYGYGFGDVGGMWSVLDGKCRTSKNGEVSGAYMLRSKKPRAGKLKGSARWKKGVLSTVDVVFDIEREGSIRYKMKLLGRDPVPTKDED